MSRVHHVVVQVELLHSVKLLAIDVAIEVDLERPLASRCRQHVTAIALEPQTNLAQLFAIKLDVCFHIVEFEPEAAWTKRTAWTSRPRRCWRSLSRVIRLALGSGVRPSSGCRRSTGKSAARWLHRLPVLGRDMQVNLPNASQPKDALRVVLLLGVRFVRGKTGRRPSQSQ